MPDTVDSLESYLLAVIVNRHAAAEDCAQSGRLLTVHSRKIRRSITDRYNSSGRISERQELLVDHFSSSTTVSTASRLNKTSGRSSMTIRLRCFSLIKPSCTA